MQARFYDPVIGRFLSIDPVGFTPEEPYMFNRYAYVGNDPVNFWDPFGECTYDDDGNAVSGLCGVDEESQALVDRQLDDPHSIASEVEAEANSQEKLIWVTKGAGSYYRSDGYLGAQAEDQVVTPEGGGIPVSAEASVEEVFEHELSHAWDDLQGGPGTGNQKIHSSGLRAPDQGEANAINRQNQWRKDKGYVTFRATYEAGWTDY